MQAGFSLNGLGPRLLQALQAPQAPGQAASPPAAARGQESVAPAIAPSDRKGLEEAQASGRSLARGSFVDIKV